ncbi:hypothetical protein K443DRAFT_105574 [Laccaria amethystina LaAM-08-1]|uniref:NB-ARC domain-containing protein n=1 Tax=Laccaria amethystina LaAM-08-1 TaxID=1095629 RepID=A0A0C9XIX6_9AGAR|nr:hypothetical protein K443DRAFT_105574 [Laccaria amethystina LaAM-08-1]
MHIHNIHNGNRTRSDGVIPLMPNPSNRFTGRTEIIAKLKRHFSNVNDSAQKRKFFLLHGMGGIGKTQICLQFIEEMSEYFSSVFWMDASSVGTITQGLKGICNLPAAKSSGLDGSPESTLHWIGLLKENYVMVFDNADILSPAELEAYFPPGRGGNILITSRNSAMRNLTSPENSLEVTEMEENDAIELLLKASCLDPFSMEFQTEASKIVKELFCLPLALDQAGAYIASGATTIGNYLAKYFEHRKTLLSHSEFTGASKYNRTVYETWELSYKEIQQGAKSDDSHKVNAANSAMILLELFPFFHHAGITEEIFSYAALQKDEKISDPELPLASCMLDQRLLPLNKAGTWDNLLFREGIRVLLVLSLIKKAPLDGVYTMHPLVHAWGRDRMTSDMRERCCLMAYVTLSCSLRWNGSQPYKFQRVLVTHVRANMEYSRSESNQNIIGYLDDAYDKFGELLQKQGYAKEAEILQIKVLDARSEIFGEDHLDTIRAMASLASTNQDLGKYIEAEKLEMQVLDARNRSLGVEHQDTINAMANLAQTYACLGKYTEAEKLEIQVLDARNRILGVEHPDTVEAMGNLAVTYFRLGKYTEAESLEIKVLNARNRILGVEDPDTIIAMANLAVTYQQLGKYTEAEKLEIQVLNARNRILGVEHPSTINATGNLASTYRALGKLIESEKLEMQVLDARNRVLGVEHPNTINAMANLAATYRNLGKYTEAEKLEIQVLNARNRILGLEHPDTINAMANLALTYGKLGKYTEAEKLLIQVLNASNKILGVEHPDTINAMANLAATYHSLGKYIEAEKLEMQVLDLSNIILGVEHPDTIYAMETLTYHQLGKYTEAEKLEIQVLDVRNRILGVGHPDTMRTMANLAGTYYEHGKYTEADKLSIQILGAEPPDMITTVANVQEAQEILLIDVGSTVPGEENLHLTQVVLNHPAQEVLPDTTMNHQKRGTYFGNCCLNPL